MDADTAARSCDVNVKYACSIGVAGSKGVNRSRITGTGRIRQTSRLIVRTNHNADVAGAPG